MDPAAVDVGRDLTDLADAEEVFGPGRDQRMLKHLRERLVLCGDTPAQLGFTLHASRGRGSMTFADEFKGGFWEKPRFPGENELEARVGIEPTMGLLQSPALPLGDPALRRSGK